MEIPVSRGNCSTSVILAQQWFSGANVDTPEKKEKNIKQQPNSQTKAFKYNEKYRDNTK